MSNRLKEQIGALAFDAVKLAMASDLSWDEAVTAFGIASKALASSASEHGDGPIVDCVAHANKRFAQGIEQDARNIKMTNDQIH